MATRFVILGATGDLTSRYLSPALAKLIETDQFPVDTIVAVGREDWDNDKFRRHIGERLDQFAKNCSEESRKKTVESMQYRQADVTDPADLKRAIGDTDGPVAVYLALPPSIFEPVVEALAELNLPEDSRIVVEKPFGDDLQSAEKLNRLLRPVFPEKSIFRIDHFLGMQTVQNVLGLRFANRVFEYLWNRDHIEQIEIVWDETVALEGRAGYYDNSGALKDMIQNHLLQLLCVVAMDAPVKFAERDFRDKKVEVLRAVRALSRDEVIRHSHRARYTAGKVGDNELPDYTAEEGVNPDKMTETFAQTTLFIDNWRWAGVPFVLRTGKAMAKDRHEILVRFRRVPFLPFEDSCPEPNQLRLSLDPDRMCLDININGANNPFALETVSLHKELLPQELSAYARLLLDLFEGNAVLSIRGDEAEESWRIVEPIIAAWRENAVPMLEYPAGSAGPKLEGG